MNNTLLDKLYKEKEQTEAKLLSINTAIRENQNLIYGGKKEKAFNLLHEIYDAIPKAKYTNVEITCDECNNIQAVDLEDALDKIEYVFNELIKHC